MTSPEAITVVLGSKLKHGLEEWNYFHKDDKINMSNVCREALQKELNMKKQMIRV